MAETEETIEAQPKGENNEDKDKDRPKGKDVLKGEPKVEDKGEDILKLGNTFRRACMLNWFELVTSGFLEEKYNSVSFCFCVIPIFWELPRS